MKKFEYKRALDPSDENLDAWGAEGWELVAVNIGFNETYIFKRVIEEPQKITAPVNSNPLTGTDALMEAAIRECGVSKLSQVKFVKESMNIGLKEAKDIVDEYHAKHPARNTYTF